MRLEVDGVLFDNDGVLVDSEAHVDEAWRQLACEFGLDVTTIAAERSGVRAIDTLERHLEGTSLDHAIVRLEQLEIELSDGVPAIPGAVELCASLPNGSWTIVTSASRRLANARWAGARIPEAPHTVTGDDVAQGKPHPEPYLTGASALGLDPTRCVVFEDSPSGGESARAAGAITIAVGSVQWAFAPHARIVDLTSVSVVDGPDPVALVIDAGESN